MMLKVRLLGQFHLELDGEVIEIPSRPAQSLFAFLILNPGTEHRRERLAGIMWPDSRESSARNNLRQALWHIRRSLRHELNSQQPYILGDRFTLRFNPQAEYALDVALLEQKLPPQASLDQWREALSAYQGELLPGFYDDWVTLPRERLRAEFHRRMQAFLERLHHERRWEQLLEWGEHWLALGDAPIPAYRFLMLAHNALGDRTSVQAVFRRHEMAAASDGMDSDADLGELLETLLRGDVSPVVEAELQDLLSGSGWGKGELKFLRSEPGEAPAKPGPFVARERELAQLQEHLSSALAGHGRVAFISGDAGSGKTALMQEFGKRAHAANATLLITVGECNALTGAGDPYLPFREVLAVLIGEIKPKWSKGSLDDEQARRLWQAVPQAISTLLAQGQDLLGSFVPIPTLRWASQVHDSVDGALRSQVEHTAATYTGAASISEPRQTGLFEQYIAILETIARQQPLLVAVDDLQWADRGSIDLLFHLGRRIQDDRVMILGAFRSDEVSLGREGRPHPLVKVLAEFKRGFGQIEVDLTAESASDGKAFIDALIDTEPNNLGHAFRSALHRQTGGNPLFTIELLRALEVSGDLYRDSASRWIINPALNWDQLPARVEGVIEERLSRLDDDLREILKVASVEGEAFTAEVVAQVLRRPPREVVDDLSHRLDRKHRLVFAQGTQRSGEQRVSLYRFRHSLFQRHLYQWLDLVERAYLHEEIGRVLEQLHAENLEAISVPLAWHFGEAGVAQKAVRYHYYAGERARRLSASAEAVGHLNHGLKVLEGLPAGVARSEQELRLRLSLGSSLTATRGYAAPEVEQAFERARQLCHEIGDFPQLFPAIWGLWSFYTTRAAHGEAHELAQQLFQLARDDSGLLLEAHRAMGTTLFYQGDVLQSRRHLETGLALYDAAQHEGHTYLYGQNPQVSCMSNLAFALWVLGYPDQDRMQAETALAYAETLAHPLSMAYARVMGAALLCTRREMEATQTWAKHAIAISNEKGFPLWLAAGKIFYGWALALQSKRRGLTILNEGLADWQDLGAELGRPHYLGLLADAYQRSGKPELARSTLEQALEIAELHGERVHEPELLRLKGQVLEMLGGPLEQVEQLYRQAIERASARRARCMELRGWISLYHLKLDEAKRRFARDGLARLLKRFSSAQVTPELVEARRLLSE